MKGDRPPFQVGEVGSLVPPRHIPRWLRRLILDAHMLYTTLYVCTLGDTTVGDYIQRSLERQGCGLPGLSCDGGRYVRPKGKLVG